LAKLGSDLAKKCPSGVYAIDDPYAALTNVPCRRDLGDRLAIGKYALRGHGIQTAGQLIRSDLTWLQKKFSVSLVRVVTELQGTACLCAGRGATPPKKGIISSRSFGRIVTALEELQEAVASFIAIAARKLRAQESAALQLSVFLYDKDRRVESASTSLSTALLLYSRAHPSCTPSPLSSLSSW
jgi:DNA polymerase V